MRLCCVRLTRFSGRSSPRLSQEKNKKEGGIVMAYETILVEQKDGIATITLNRPEVLNAFTLKMGGELMDALRSVKEDEETKVLIFTRVGLVPEFSSSYLLPKLIGLGKALELVLTARMIDAHEAKEIGLVNKVVPANTFMDETLAMAQMMAKGASVALKLAKRALHHGAGATMLQAMQYEHFAQAHCAETFDHEEAVRAFLEK